MAIEKLPDNTRCTDVLGKCASLFQKENVWRLHQGDAWIKVILSL
jgi:hypothetical protein